MRLTIRGRRFVKYSALRKAVGNYNLHSFRCTVRQKNASLFQSRTPSVPPTMLDSSFRTLPTIDKNDYLFLCNSREPALSMIFLGGGEAIDIVRDVDSTGVMDRGKYSIRP